MNKSSSKEYFKFFIIYTTKISTLTSEDLASEKAKSQMSLAKSGLSAPPRSQISGRTKKSDFAGYIDGVNKICEFSKFSKFSYGDVQFNI